LVNTHTQIVVFKNSRKIAKRVLSKVVYFNKKWNHNIIYITIEAQNLAAGAANLRPNTYNGLAG